MRRSGPNELNILRSAASASAFCNIISSMTNRLGGWSKVDFRPLAAGRNGCQPVRGRSCLADHVLRGDADLAIILHVFVRCGERKARRWSVIPASCKTRSSGRGSAGQPTMFYPLGPQRFAEQTDIVVARFVHEFSAPGVRHAARRPTISAQHRSQARRRWHRSFAGQRRVLRRSRVARTCRTSTLRRWKALNILYDADAKGAYFSGLCRDDRGGFFFEIVQQRDHYGGYGAKTQPSGSMRSRYSRRVTMQPCRNDA